MRMRDFGSTGLKVSEIIYGGIVATMDRYNGYTYQDDGQAASDRDVAYALDAGINYFDVAPKYGNAQEMLGNSLRGVRERIILACKTEMRDYDSAARAAERSLKLLHTDHFDIYQIHALCNEGDVRRIFESDGAMKLVEELRRSGTARHVGFTTHSEGAALTAMDLYDFESVMLPANWHMNMAIGYGDRMLKKAKEKGMAVIGMKSMVERGFRPGPEDDVFRRKWPKCWCKLFDEETQADLLLAALRFAVAQGIDTLVPAGDVEHFRFAVEHADEIWATPLSEADMALLRAHLPSVEDALFMPEYDR